MKYPSVSLSSTHHFYAIATLLMTQLEISFELGAGQRIIGQSTTTSYVLLAADMLLRSLYWLKQLLDYSKKYKLVI